jgi:hypothetical protein
MSVIVAAVSVPRITAKPKRLVGGNVDRIKIPNPAQMIMLARSTGALI